MLHMLFCMFFRTMFRMLLCSREELELLDVLEMVEVMLETMLEVMRCVLLCIPEAVEGVLCLLEALEALEMLRTAE